MLSQTEFLFFHAMIELFAVIVSFGVFFIAWDTRRFGAYPFFLIIGPAFAIVGLLDVLHTLTYKGMGTFPSGSANLPTQLWIAARGTETLAVLSGVMLAHRHIRPSVPLFVFLLLGGMLLASVSVVPVFPDCYIDGVGLTLFKVTAEYVLIALKLATLALLWPRRGLFDPLAMRWLVLYLVLGILSEASFTSYIGVYDGMNQLGHVLKVLTYGALYLATVKAVLQRPYSTLFRDLEAARNSLEEAVIARTRQLADSEERLRSLMANVPDAIVTVHADGTIEGCNDAVVPLLGYTADELIGARVDSLMTDAGAAAAAARLVGKGSREVMVRRKDGALVAVDLAVNLMRLAGRRVYIGVLRDISERIRIRRQQAAAERELMRMQKMESLGSLASGIAHEVNNMLTPILGLTELTLMRLPEGSPAHGNLEKVMEAGARARDILNKLLAFSRVDTSTKEILALPGLIEESLPLLRASVPRGVRLDCQVPDLPLAVRGGRTEFLQVLMNLCNNAGQAVAGGGGRIAIELRRWRVSENDGGVLPPGDYARLTVRDNGVGIPFEVQERIFEPFFTTKPVGDGTGMGLSVVHAIVSAWKGGITVETAPGDGAAFHILLPLADALVPA